MTQLSEPPQWQNITLGLLPKCGADRWRDDPTRHLPPYKTFKTKTESSQSLRQAESRCFFFFYDNHFAYMLKKCTKNPKQQFTAAICLNKGCPDYPSVGRLIPAKAN